MPTSSKIERILFRLPPPFVKSNIRCQLLQRWGAKVGKDVSISANLKISHPQNLEIGDDCSISNVLLSSWATISIGNHVIIGQDAKIVTGNHNLHSPHFEGKLYPIKIEDYAWISINAIVLGGVTIGRGAVVGAGAVVRESIPALSIAIGNPATVVGYRKCQDFDYHPGVFSCQYS